MSQRRCEKCGGEMSPSVWALSKQLALLVEENHRLRMALLPFADYPLPDAVVVELGVKVPDWKKAIEIVGSD